MVQVDNQTRLGVPVILNGGVCAFTTSSAAAEEFDGILDPRCLFLRNTACLPGSARSLPETALSLPKW